MMTNSCKVFLLALLASSVTGLRMETKKHSKFHGKPMSEIQDAMGIVRGRGKKALSVPDCTATEEAGCAAPCVWYAPTCGDPCNENNAFSGAGLPEPTAEEKAACGLATDCEAHPTEGGVCVSKHTHDDDPTPADTDDDCLAIEKKKDCEKHDSKACKWNKHKNDKKSSCYSKCNAILGKSECEASIQGCGWGQNANSETCSKKHKVHKTREAWKNHAKAQRQKGRDCKNNKKKGRCEKRGSCEWTEAVDAEDATDTAPEAKASCGARPIPCLATGDQRCSCALLERATGTPDINDRKTACEDGDFPIVQTYGNKPRVNKVCFIAWDATDGAGSCKLASDRCLDVAAVKETCEADKDFNGNPCKFKAARDEKGKGKDKKEARDASCAKESRKQTRRRKQEAKERRQRRRQRRAERKAAKEGGN